MATARDIVTRAIRKRVKEAGLVPTSDELEDGLADLNSMLAEWELDGLDIGHTELAASDTVDVPASYELTIILSLAERLTEYGSPLEALDVAKAEDGRGLIRAHLLNVGVQTFDSALRGDRCR
jgi:hypothetical protein